MIEHVVERNRTEALRNLEETCGRLSDLEVEPRLLIADQVEGALHQLAELEGIDLVILTAHGRTAEAGWPYGSVVVSFLAYGFAPVLIVQDVRPEEVRPTYAELALHEMGRR
jgi:nucleotide-binding universal stress UspA family protein